MAEKVIVLRCQLSNKPQARTTPRGVAVTVKPVDLSGAYDLFIGKIEICAAWNRSVPHLDKLQAVGKFPPPDLSKFPFGSKKNIAVWRLSTLRHYSPALAERCLAVHLLLKTLPPIAA